MSDPEPPAHNSNRQSSTNRQRQSQHDYKAAKHKSSNSLQILINGHFDEQRLPSPRSMQLKKEMEFNGMTDVAGSIGFSMQQPMSNASSHNKSKYAVYKTFQL